ncbi:MAG: two component, sigma54 specific, transcriptional regulator, Fis family [Bacteriovoracaceae bacterium]|nr:two component, sigma54 specific, transcriptional regulator, Fis family [Bacteriovoracaceae bacterium]
MKILIIDDETSLLKLLKLSLATPETTVLTAETAKQGLDIFKTDIFDAVLCDIGLPDLDGLQVLEQLKIIHAETPVIMITAHGSIQTALTAMKNGAYDYIQKPFEPEEISLVIQRALKENKLQKDYTRLKHEVSTAYDFSNIVGNSSALKDVFQKIKKAADTKSTILILGESGTGKELLAKAIHFNSSRKDAPFVVVDCGAIPDHLLESELFGHLKGAFTGADRAKKGLCEEADKGTLFLDEIGELPFDLQSKLLRLLQENTIRRVGDTKQIPVDIRVIAATNRNLEDDIKTGKFRQDLFYRLNVVPLRSPSLRERRDDIPLLSHFFLKRYCKDYGRNIATIDPQVMNKFVSFDWPGNVRQLQNLIEQMVVMADGNTLSLDSLPPPLNTTPINEPPQIQANEWDLKKAIAQIQAYTEECMIRKGLSHTKNNKTKAAELLGISRRALIYKVQEYKLEDVSAELKEEEGKTDASS